jgi:predicted  nucleic acid-binding Zn-ribbon protein
MHDTLRSLIALQALDSAADAARKRIAEMPAAERTLDQQIARAKAVVDAVQARIQTTENARRQLEKDTATLDARMAQFKSHQAAVKTNQEYTALIHEIEVAQQTKAGLDDQGLELLTAIDDMSAEKATAEAALAATTTEANTQRAALRAEKAHLESELARLAKDRAAATPAVPPAVLAKYDQIAKNRKGVAVSEMVGGLCRVCNVRLRPTIEQQVRRMDAIVQCDSCQRILYYVAPPAAPATEGA